MKVVPLNSLVICLALSCGATAAGAAEAAPAAEGGVPVSLADGGAAATISNGILSVTLSKAKASITSLRFRGFEMLKAGYYSMDGGKAFRRLPLPL